MHIYLNLGKRSNYGRRSRSLRIRRDSFTLVEVLLFVSILSVFFVLAASVVTVTLRNMKFNEHKIKALHYSRQLEDWLRVQKEIDWGGDQCSGSCCAIACNFTQRVTQGSLNPKFCFNNFPISEWPAANLLGFDCDYSLDSIFSREVQFQSLPADSYINQVSLIITTSWLELGLQKSVTSTTIFSIFESVPTPTPP